MNSQQQEEEEDVYDEEEYDKEDEEEGGSAGGAFLAGGVGLVALALGAVAIVMCCIWAPCCKTPDADPNKGGGSPEKPGLAAPGGTTATNTNANGEPQAEPAPGEQTNTEVITPEGGDDKKSSRSSGSSKGSNSQGSKARSGEMSGKSSDASGTSKESSKGAASKAGAPGLMLCGGLFVALAAAMHFFGDNRMVGNMSRPLSGAHIGSYGPKFVLGGLGAVLLMMGGTCGYCQRRTRLAEAKTD